MQQTSQTHGELRCCDGAQKGKQSGLLALAIGPLLLFPCLSVLSVSVAGVFKDPLLRCGSRPLGGGRAQVI